MFRYVDLSDLAREAKPLDSLFFKGTGIVAKLIAIAEKFVVGNDEWTHVGLVVDTTLFDIKNGVPGRLYVNESTSSIGRKTGDVRDGKSRFGVQVRDLEEVAREYLADPDAKIALCSLIDNPLVVPDGADEELYRRADTTRTLAKIFLDQHGHDAYEYNPCLLLKPFFSCIKLRSDNRYFCSELVHNVYQRLGIIASTEDSETITPVELAAILFDGPRPICERPRYILLN